MMNRASRVLIPLFAIPLVAVMTPGAPLAAPQDPVAVFSAQAVNLDSPAGAATGLVQIQITRWSTDAERDRVMNTLLEQGPDKLLDVLSKLPSVGSIRTPDTVGYDLRYARQSSTGGAQQVVLITDRPLSFYERRQISRSTDYPFTVIELRVNSNGQGEGKMSIATKITANKATGTIALENFNIGPVLLQNVRREK